MGTDSQARTAERYRQGIPALDLFVERATGRVPDDGRYYLVERGEVVAGFRTLASARRLYLQRRHDLGYEPPVQDQVCTDELIRREDLERDLLRTASYWAESHRFGQTGGRLKHR